MAVTGGVRAAMRVRASCSSSLWNGGADPSVVAAVDAVHGCLDADHVIVRLRQTVEDKRRPKVVGCAASLTFR